ncbi:MAG: ACP S-malonyltransferase [Candidatus Omnitrophica bacterium]|nr:ACP S-malonyltransferase [Candidatus Omnitrophota bacterium]MBU4148890.1 ACP S-malonyltransferase [Candidatus Omnitrophota bacterium]
MKKIAYIFPGQGAQYVGMGRDLYDNCPEAKKVFDEADNIIPDAGIKRLCFEGPLEELTQTANSQVCILVASIAALRVLEPKVKGEGWRVEACAGLSLGELTSLVAAGSINFTDAVKLVRRRGELMEEASMKNPGGMASIIGLQLEHLKDICVHTGSEIANLNCPGQIVISGGKEAVAKCMAMAVEKGAKKAISLKVSGAFHSSLMKEAAEKFRAELEKVTFSAPAIRVISNVTAEEEALPEGIKENLVRQLYSPVRWEESVRKMSREGVEIFFEIGPGKVLKGLLRRIDADLKVYNIETLEDIKKVPRPPKAGSGPNFAKQNLGGTHV